MFVPSLKYIDIWQFSYTESLYNSFNSTDILSYQEIETANGLKFIKHKKRYILFHKILRIVLSKYIDIKPKQIVFHTNDYGKPYLPEYNIQFNITHSNGMLAIAIWKKQIGIDLENLDRSLDFIDMAKQVLSSEEFQALTNLTLENSTSLFFNLWTQKEALLKAIGTGLNNSMIHINLIDKKEINIDGNMWQIEKIKPIDKNYIGHVAYLSKNKVHLRCYNNHSL